MRRMVAILLLTFILMGLSIPVFAQDTRYATLESKTFFKWRNVGTVVTENNVAYLEVQVGVSIADISDPSNSFEIGFIYQDEINDIALINSRLFIAYRNGFKILDVSDPNNVVLLSNITQCNNQVFYPSKIRVSDNCAYIYSWYNGSYYIVAYDTTDTSNPLYASTLNINLSDYLVSGNLIYGIYNDLTVIDVTNPYDIHVVNSQAINGNVQSLSLYEDYVYISKYASGNSEAGIYAYNISNPENPVYSGLCFPLAATITISEGRGYISEGMQGIMIVDTSNPVSFFYLGRCLPHYSTSQKSVVRGDYVYVPDLGYGVDIIDVSDPNDSHIESNIISEGSINSVDVQGNYAYILDSGIGLLIVDISNTMNPLLVGRCNFTEYASDIEVRGDYIYVFKHSYYELEITVYNVENPRNCYITGSVIIPITGGYGYEFGNDLLYVISYLTLQIVDVSNPENPHEIASFQNNIITSFAVVGQNMYRFDYNSTILYIESYENPLNPVTLGSIPLPYGGTSIKTAGNYAIVAYNQYRGDPDYAYYDSGFYIIDVSNSASPHLIRQMGPYHNAFYMYTILAISDGYAFYNAESNISLLYMANPSNAQILGYLLELNADFKDFDVGGNHMFVAERNYFAIYDFSSMTLNEDDVIPNIDTGILKQNSPNPFTAETEITYEVTKSGNVKLSVYNTKGQLVRKIVNELQSKGPHTVSWDGTDSNNGKVSAGVYFYRLETAEGTQSRKCLLLK